MLDSRIIYLIGSFGDAGNRPVVAQKLAQLLGAENLLIFSKDPLLNVLLPAPGFPQTLQGGKEWKTFLDECVKNRQAATKLISPFLLRPETVIGFAAPDDSVLVLLGGAPDLVEAAEVTALVPLIAAALSNERIEFTAKGAIEAESMAAEQARSLAAALDTTRRNLESALRKSTSILESISDAFFSLDRQWRFVEMNAAAEKLLGMKREQLLDRVIWEVFPEAVGSAFQIQYQRALGSQKALRFEEYFPLKQGWYEVRVFPSRDGVAVYFADIDEQRRTAEELRVSQAWFKTTLQSIGDGVIAMNRDRSISFLNPVAEALTGWTLEEALGKPMSEVFNIVHEESRKPALNPVERVLAEGRVMSLANHTVLISRTGEEYPIEDSAAPIRNPQGEITGVVLVFRDVTGEYAQKSKLKDANQQLQAERSRLEAVLQQMPEGVIIAEPSGKLILRNAQMDAMLGGYIQCDSIEEYGQYKGFKPSGEPYLAHEWPLARSLTKGEKVFAEEVELMRIDGGRAVVSISSAPIYDETGKIVAGVVIHHDITQMKQIEADLRYQSYLTRTITDNAASCLFMMDKAGHPTFMNPAAQEVTGYSTLEEIKDRPLHYAVHWKKPDGTPYPMDECPIDNAQSELKPVQNQEEIFCRKDGTLFPVSYSVTPLEKNGEVVGSVLEFREITEQRNTERALKQSLETLSVINQVGQRLTAELDMDRLVQQVTDAATKLSGAQFGALFYTAKNEQNESYLLYALSGVPREAFSKFPNPRSTAVFHPTFVNEGTVRSDDITQDPRYGKNDPHRGMPKGHLPVRSYLAVSVVSRSGEVLGGLFFGHEKPGVFTEQTEKIVEGLAAQAAVAMDNARLYRNVQESVRARDEFLSIASHELKTPLTSLKLQAQMRARNLKKGNLSSFSPEGLVKMVESDARQIERLSRLIDDMLDISRISTGKLAMQLEYFDLCELVQDVVDRYTPQFQEVGSKVSIICCDPVKGHWDRFRIEQVVTNLLTNAIRYGAGKPVNVSVCVANDRAVLKVQDQGIGIAKESQQRIFDRFERAISANEISGLGLGLYIVKQILEMHGGIVQVESELGKGATFIVELPLRQAKYA